MALGLAGAGRPGAGLLLPGALLGAGEPGQGPGLVTQTSTETLPGQLMVRYVQGGDELRPQFESW